MSRIDRRPIVAPLGSFFPRSLFGGGKGGGGAALTCSPSILARSASTCAMTSKKRSREKEGESGGGRGRKESSRRANRFLELKPPSRPSMFFLRESRRRENQHNPFFQTLSLSFGLRFSSSQNDDLPPLLRGRARRPRGLIVVVVVARGDRPPLRRSCSFVDDAGARFVVVAPLAQVPGPSRCGREPSRVRRLR